MIDGELDGAEAPVLEKTIAELLARPGETASLLLDLEACPFVDGGGMGAFIFALEVLPPDGILILVGARHHIRRLVGLAGLGNDPRFQACDSAAEAATFIERQSLGKNEFSQQ